MNIQQTSRNKLRNAFCAILMVILIVLQFVPFWEIDGQSVSISGYIWLPLDHEELTAHFQETVDSEFKVDSLVLSSFLQLVVPAIGIGIFLYNRESVFTPICSAAAGIGGIWSYLAKPVFRLGLHWQMHFAVAILIFAIALVAIIGCWKKR